MNSYTLNLSEDERMVLITALGVIHGIKFARPPQPFDLFERLVALTPYPGETAATAPQPMAPPASAIGPGKAAAAAILSPPAKPATTVPIDHWAKKTPDKWNTIEVPISKVEEKPGPHGVYLRVTWPNQGRGFAYGSVFDEGLFPFIKAREKQRTTLYVVTAGKYTNIVGVRA